MYCNKEEEDIQVYVCTWGKRHETVLQCYAQKRKKKKLERINQTNKRTNNRSVDCEAMKRNERDKCNRKRTNGMLNRENQLSHTLNLQHTEIKVIEIPEMVWLLQTRTHTHIFYIYIYIYRENFYIQISFYIIPI